MVDIICELEKGVSKNNGKEYFKIKIPLAPDYEKVVFLDSAEKALVNLTYNEE